MKNITEISKYVIACLLYSSAALANVDITQMEQVKVGSWAELKAAVEDSANAGKAIVLTGDIEVDDTDAAIEKVGGAGIIIDGGGYNITLQDGASDGRFINFNQDKTDLIIQNVNLEGFNVETGYAYGGAIYNYYGTIGNISGDFSGNYAKSEFGSAQGGAIYNNYGGTIGDITGDFINNYAQGSSSAYGGAIYNENNANIGDINGDFSGNHAKSETGYAVGGAIHNENNANIGDINGDFSDNFVQSSFTALGGAIYNAQTATIGDITGNFTDNYAKSETLYAYGGAIYNSYATIENISSDFSGNYAQSESGNAHGGAIYNGNGTIGDIIGDFTENYAQSESGVVYGGAIYNSGTIENISSNFTENYAYGKREAYGGAIYNGNGTIGDIIGDFSGNYAKSESGSAEGGAIVNSYTIGDITGDFTGNYAQGFSAQGGAIYNYGGTIGNITGDFSNNYAQSNSSYAYGGAIYNGINSTIQSITGDFTKNYAKSDSVYAQGGAIYNSGMMTLTNSSFYDNYVETTALKDSKLGRQTQGGAIYTASDLTIKADNGQSIFSGNKVIWGDGKEDSSAIHLGVDNDVVASLNLNSVNSGLILFDDKITSISQIDILLQDYQQGGATITSDNNGGYIIDKDGQQIHLENKKNGTFYVPISQQEGLTKDQVDQMLSTVPPEYEVKQDGDNYIVTGEVDGMTGVYEFIKQGEDLYSMMASYIISAYGGNITITGDDTSRVEFNNAIENITKIDISGTNVDVNKGAGTIYRTVTHDGGVLNINAGAKAEDSIIDQGGVMNVANTAEIRRTAINNGGILNVASGGYAEDTTVNSGGKLDAETQARLNNLLANGGAILDIDSGAVLTGNIVIHADAQMGGSYDYSKIFKDEVLDAGSLTLVGGLNDVMTETSLVNNTEGKNLHLTAGDYVIGTQAQAVLGWDLLTLKDNANVKLEGDVALNGPKKKLVIENGSILDLAGNSPSNYTITGSVNNDGSMSFTHSGDDADDITTIFGNYTAYNNATMTMDVNPSNNTSDLLRIEGDVSGTTKVDLNIVGADVKPSQLVAFVEAPNDLDSTGAYFVINRVYNSAYVWKSLYKDGVWYTGTEDMIQGGDAGYGDGDNGDLDEDAIGEETVLPPNMPDVPDITIPDGGDGNKRSPSVVAEAIAYMGLPSVGIEQTRDMTRNVANKVASTKTYSEQCKGFYDCSYDGAPLRNAWAAPVYSYSDVKAPYSYEAEITGFEGGFDIQSDVYNRLGVYASYRQGKYEFDGDGEDYYSRVGSEIDIDSYILGLYHRYDEGRKWVMSQIFLGYQDVSMTTDDGISSETDGIEFGGSIEGGLIFNPMTNLTVEPIIRLAYTQINYDDASDRYRKTARYGDVRNIEVEAGVKVEKTYQRKNGYAKIYVKPSIIQNIGSGDVTVTSLRQVDGLGNSTLGRIEVGGSMSFDEQWSGYANAAYTFGSDYTNAAVNAGLNYAF